MADGYYVALAKQRQAQARAQQAQANASQQKMANLAGRGIGTYFAGKTAADALPSAMGPQTMVDGSGQLMSEMTAQQMGELGMTTMKDSAGNAIGSQMPASQAANLAGGPGTWGAANVAGGLAGAAGLAYGGYKGYEGIKAGDPIAAGMGGLGAGMGGAALASSLGAFGAGGIAGLGAGLGANLVALGPYGIAAGAAMAAAAQGQKKRWGKGDKNLETVRRQFIQKRMKEMGLLDDNVAGIKGHTGFDLGDKGFIHVGEGKDSRYRIAMDPMGEIDPNVYISEKDMKDVQNWRDKGYHYGDFIDWSKEGMAQQVADAAGLSYLIKGGDQQKLGSDATGYLVNALQKIGGQEADGDDFLKAQYQKLYGADGGDPREGAIAAIGNLMNTGKLDKWKGFIAQKNINEQYGYKGEGGQMSDAQNAELDSWKKNYEINEAKKLGMSQDEYTERFAAQRAGLGTGDRNLFEI